jgi:hypothetical protein
MPWTALVTKDSLATARSARVSGAILVTMPASVASLRMAARVIPGRRRVSAGGVRRMPSVTAKMLARSVSRMWPSVSSIRR